MIPITLKSKTDTLYSYPLINSPNSNNNNNNNNNKTAHTPFRLLLLLITAYKNIMFFRIVAKNGAALPPPAFLGSCGNIFAKSKSTTTTAATTIRHFKSTSRRSFGTKPPGNDPLELIRKECLNRNLCDEHGYRRPGVHWVFSIAITPDDPKLPPNLRTVGVQRVSPDGIDFVMKKGSFTCDSIRDGRPMSILHLQGRYVPGETAEQWRGEGYCQIMPLSDIVNQLPHYTITAMVSSKRMEKESTVLSSGERPIMENRSHMTEVQQKTRMELENGDVSEQEIDEAIRAFRFHPTRVECMVGGPDSVLWNRWEWTRDEDGIWNPPTALLPH